MARRLKHDRYITDLCERIGSDYDSLSVNVCLFSKKKQKRSRVLAEIDVLAQKEGRCDVYEVKCSPRIVKARKQLRRIKRLMPNIDNAYFFCGESGLIQKINEE